MSHRRVEGLSRRQFLGGLTLAGTAGLIGLHPRLVAAEPPPETTRLRLAQSSAICISPLYVAKELLPGEGFTDAQYVKIGRELFTQAVVSGEVDIAMNFVGPLLIPVDAGDSVVMLAGATSAASS
jgi:NitT/TauT family transport system substrate-binding protein